MSTLRVDILNPKAAKLLKTLADMNLISIKEEKKSDLISVVKKIRSKAAKNPPSLAEITREVETVRAERYARSRK